MAQVISRFTEIIGLDRFAIYVFDYGAPVGLRIALEHPERITAIISQNGNAYEEGLSAGWDSLREYWRHPTPAAHYAGQQQQFRYRKIYPGGAETNNLIQPKTDRADPGFAKQSIGL